MLKVDVLALGMLTLHPQGLRPDRAALRQRLHARDHAAATIRRSTTMLSQRRFRRRVPGREPGADVDAAAAEAARLLRPRHRGGDRAARARSRATWCIPICAGATASRSTVAYPDRRDELEGRAEAARWACRCSRSRRCRSPSSAAGFTPDEADELRRAMATFRHTGTIHTLPREVHRRHDAATATSASSPSAASARSRASASTAFPRATRRASRSSSTSRPGSSATTRTSSAPRILNSQPMGFYQPAQLVRDAREHGVEVLPPRRQRQRLGLHAGTLPVCPRDPRAQRAPSGASCRGPWIAGGWTRA